MLNRFAFVLVCLASLPLFAQAPAPQEPAATTAAESEQKVPEGGMPYYIRPETPEQRRERVGNVDPGIDPDPNQTFWRHGFEQYIMKYERKWATDRLQPQGWIRPFGPANLSAEIYQMNEKYVWVWWVKIPPREADEPSLHDITLPKETIEYLVDLQSDFIPRTPEPSGVTIAFKESSTGLPTSGSWRNNAVVADMNGDGHLDIVTGPERKGTPTPSIFLGDGKGNWKRWETTFPFGIDYGGVAVGDLNKDGHMDIVSAVHMVGVHAFLGDGKGTFTDASEGLELPFPTRRAAVVDVDRDGWLDIVAIHEGPTAVAQPVPTGRLLAFLNRAKGTKWEVMDIADPRAQFGGDYMAFGKFNGDPYPDFAASSVFLNGIDLIHVSEKKNRWKVAIAGDRAILPMYSMYYAMTAGRFGSKSRDDLILSFVRSWPGSIQSREIEPPSVTKIVGIERVSFAGKEPKRFPIARWKGEIPLRGLAFADVNRDGHLDLLYTPAEPRALEILLGDGKGGFKRAAVEGVVLSENPNYDLTVADVNGDKWPDVIVMYETEESKDVFAVRDGSIQVFLGQSPIAPSVASSR